MNHQEFSERQFEKYNLSFLFTYSNSSDTVDQNNKAFIICI